jgi:hypothetical protein
MSERIIKLTCGDSHLVTDMLSYDHKGLATDIEKHSIREWFSVMTLGG